MEKRESQRFPFSARAAYEVSAHQKLFDLRDKKQGATQEAQIRNISERGVCLLTPQAFHPSQIIMLHLPLADVGVVIPAVAEVRWVRPGSSDGHYETGLRFLL